MEQVIFNGVTGPQPYAEGYAAFAAGESIETNSYPSATGSQARIDWYNGWYDAKHESLFPHLFPTATHTGR